MAGRLSRFLHLERARDPRERGGEAPAVERSGRFGGVEPTGAAPEQVRSAAGHLARFDVGAAPDEVHLQARTEADQPFIRCARCEADNGRFGRTCVGCGAPLDSAEQRAFNERLWADRRAAAEAERARHAEYARAREAEIETTSKEKRAYYEELARNVRAETEARMGGSFREAGWSDLLWGIGRRRFGRRHGPRLPAGVQLLLLGAIGVSLLFGGRIGGPGVGTRIFLGVVVLAGIVLTTLLRRR